MASGHGGNLSRLAAQAGKPAAAILDFSANINPLGPPEWLRAVLSRQVEAVVHYPPPYAEALVEAVARRHGVTAEQVVIGNGSTELIYALPRALELPRAVIPVPAYIDYAAAARLAGRTVETIQMSETNGFAPDLALFAAHLRGDELIFLGQPNNPTGLLFEAEELRRMAAEHSSTIFVVDEAFADFVAGYDTLIHERPANVVVLCSLTKLYAIPGLRLGYMVADPEVAGRVRKLLPPWSVNVFAQAVGEEALADVEYLRRTIEYVSEQREQLARDLAAMPGLTVYPGRANFLLVRLEREDLAAHLLAKRVLASHAVAIRVCDNFAGLDARFFRVAVRTPEENAVLCQALAECLVTPATKKGRARPAKKAACIMFQGTGSSAGKSVLTAALCRILLQDGFRVAPFKAQNMSLNSFVTRDGGEMGRAQVMQAQACRLDPEVRMNPVLLKPCSDTGAQVIVRGQPVANMDVAQYTQYKNEAFKTVKECFDALAAEYDVLVLEGAGSPGEVNLKHHDIVNMRMARYAQAPVLLVGDIDRGGVFAAFVGTMEVLAEWERALVAGFVVNRFRGDASLLDSALEYTRRHTGRPVLGVVPYLSDLNLPQEDSVEFKSGSLDEAAPRNGGVEIAVVDLPHISNFTDFDPFRLEPDVRLRIIRSAADFDLDTEQLDALIIPGSKNVLADLAYLKDSGLAARLTQLAESTKTEMIGICAGFQMLGTQIHDPHGIESAAGKADGLGLLAAATVLAPEKTLVRVSGKHTPSGLPVFGYEIHHGQTEAAELTPIIMDAGNDVVGVADPARRIWGTYLHGIFDADEFRRWFIDHLRQRRGMAPLGKVAANYDLEPMFDRLAAAVRENLQIGEIYKLMGLSSHRMTE